MEANKETEKLLSPKRRSKGAERQKEEGGISAKDVAMFGAEMIPGVGEAMAVKRTSDALDEKDYLSAGIEAAAGLMGIIPGVGDAAGRGLREVTKVLRKDAKLNIDNPGFDEIYQETYSETKQKSADAAKERAIKRGQKDTYAVNLGNEEGVTGYANKVTFKPEELKDLPGAMGEEKFRSSGEKLKRLKKSIAKEGYKPENNTILIHVREDGQPFVVEGNTRLAEALESGRETINADIRYLRGAEEKTGPLDPKNIFPNQIKEADALEIGINPATKDGALLKGYDTATSKNISKNSSAATAGTKEANKLINAKVADGTKVGIRLNLNSTIPNMPKGLDKLQTLHKNNYNGKALSYKPFATVEDVTFNVSQKGRQGIAAKIKSIDVPEAKSKFPAMSVDGKYNNTRNVLDEIDDDVVEIGFNPVSGHLFIDLSTGQAVKSADVATVIGDRVYAKGVTYMKKAEAPNPLSASDGTPLPSEVRYKMKKGGVVPMDKQMSMFDDGGLMDEGGTVDPVSGNDVPPGSTQEEVRDDIPAQLSEGEFVFPADVVRYIGLGNLMRMRQEAKMGLKLMEQMGQMGNSEEATMPDNLPFDINDLDIEDEINDNNELEMQVGGFVQPTQQQQQMGISGYQQAVAPTTGVAAVPQQAASQQYVQPVQPVQAAVPTTPVYTVADIPTFKGFVGENVPGVDFEYVEYKNEAGNVIQLRKSKTTGDLLDPIPEGYTFVDPEETATEEVTTTPTTSQTTSVRADASRDERQEQRQREEEEEFGPGGGRLGINKTIYGVSFEGINPLTQGRSLLGSLVLGGMIPANLVDGISVNLQNKDGKFNVTGQEYNAIKQSIKEHGANSEITSSLMDKLRLDAKTREAQRAAAAAKREEERVTAASIIKGDDKDSSDKGESYDVSKKGAALEASLKSSPTPGGKGVGRQDYSGGGNRPDSKSEEKSGSSGPPSGGGKSSSSGSSGSSKSSSSGSSSSGETFDSRGGRGRFGGNEGGLASKPKPKDKKKMKRGGLASKK